MVRILYLSPGPAPPSKDPKKNKFYHLSQYLSGDLLAPIWGRKTPKSIETIEEINLAMSNFQYHVTFSCRLPRFIKSFWDIFFYIFRGLYLHYCKEKYDVIVTYGVFKTGLAGYLLKKLARTKLIIEVPGDPKKSFLFNSKEPDSICKLNSKISNILVPFIINRADHIKLLYPSQLNGYKNSKKTPRSIFHNFVSINTCKAVEESDKYILFLGYPWFLKGVDVLIKAFKLVSREIPDYTLKIVGFCPDKTYFENLADGNCRIELCKPVFYREAMELMSKCALFVLPSRTEAMGRVLLEAMASRKPIIASNVDGIPHYIKHGFNGLLFESENIEDLAKKIRIVLSKPDYAVKLAENGYKYVYNDLSEVCYLGHFKKMIDMTLSSNSCSDGHSAHEDAV